MCSRARASLRQLPLNGGSDKTKIPMIFIKLSFLHHPSIPSHFSLPPKEEPLSLLADEHGSAIARTGGEVLLAISGDIAGNIGISGEIVLRWYLIAPIEDGGCPRYSCVLGLRKFACARSTTMSTENDGWWREAERGGRIRRLLSSLAPALSYRRGLELNFVPLWRPSTWRTSNDYSTKNMGKG